MGVIDKLNCALDMLNDDMEDLFDDVFEVDSDNEEFQLSCRGRK